MRDEFPFLSDACWRGRSHRSNHWAVSLCMRHGGCVAAVVLVLWAAALAAHAQTAIYRCGNSYSEVPRQGAQVLQMAPAGQAKLPAKPEEKFRDQSTKATQKAAEKAPQGKPTSSASQRKREAKTLDLHRS